ncbi:MAG TPA: IclR family transcriptional regulator [Virgibacillus sp.]|nr:IclR family transcriptional regulator [Virgibacillus sp.]HLR68292.1 IclR family transcriptional regulator [Virgibacillus sp.]
MDIQKQPKLLSSVKNALQVMNSFTIEYPERTVGELSVELGLAKSTVSRLLTTLASEGFVIKDPNTRKYRLGISILALSGIITSNFEITKEAAPVVNKLVNDLGETAHLTILDGTDTIYIHKEECTHAVRILTYLGKRNPAYCTSSGKVLLAYSSNAVVNQVIEKGFESFTKKTITNGKKLLSELEKIRRKGYAYSKDEILEGVTSIAAPVYDYTGEVVAAITVVGPEQRISNNKLPVYTKKLIDASKEASERLGYLFRR